MKQSRQRNGIVSPTARNDKVRHFNFHWNPYFNAPGYLLPAFAGTSFAGMTCIAFSGFTV